MSHEPPRFITWLLRRCLPSDTVGASILGDLREEYEQNTRARRARYICAALALSLRYAAARVGTSIVRILRGGNPEREPKRSVLRTIADDFGDAWRGLRRRPLFAAAGIGLLACGLAATSIVFSFVDALMLRPLPLMDASDTLVRIQERSSKPGVAGAQFHNLTAPDIVRLGEAVPSLAATAAMVDGGTIPISTPDGATRIPVARATSGFFDIVGVRPFMGRAFGVDDDQPGAPRVVVLSYAGWQRLFAGRADAIGARVTLNREVHTVVGVMPRGFRFPAPSDAYLPMRRSPFTERFHVATGLARLRPGVSLEQVNAEVDAVIAALAAEEPGARHGTGARVLPWREVATERVRPAMRILVAAAALVLILAAANLGGLLAHRTTARSREMTVRRSLGATNAAVVRLLVAEGIMLALGGAAVGLGLTALTLRTVVALSPTDLPFRDAVHLDLRVLGFTAMVAVLAGIVAGLVPALRARRQSLVAGERSGPRSGVARSARILVVAQIAAAMVLVSCAGLLMRSFANALAVDPGVRTEGILAAGISLSNNDEGRQRAFFGRALEELRRTPGVTAAEVSLWAPLDGSMPVTVTRYRDDRQKTSIFLNAVTPGFLSLVRLPVLEGRGFEDRDDERREPVALLSRMAATLLFPGEPAVGRTLISDEDSFRVVGIVGDVRQEGTLEEPRPMIYVPFWQHSLFGAGNFLIETDTDPAGIFAALRAIVRRLDPDVPLDHAGSLSAMVDEDLAQPRFYSVVVGVFGALALGLAIAGLYAVIAFATTRRMFEFGIRSALGARPIDNLWMVCRDGLSLSLIGILLGALIAARATHLLQTLLYGVRAGDLRMLIVAGGLMLMIALLAVLTPALRAARVDPVAALRAE